MWPSDRVRLAGPWPRRWRWRCRLDPVALGSIGAKCDPLVSEAPGAWHGAAMIAVGVLLLTMTTPPPLVRTIAAGITGAFVPW